MALVPSQAGTAAVVGQRPGARAEHPPSPRHPRAARPLAAAGGQRACVPTGVTRAPAPVRIMDGGPPPSEGELLPPTPTPALSDEAAPEQGALDAALRDAAVQPSEGQQRTEPAAPGEEADPRAQGEEAGPTSAPGEAGESQPSTSAVEEAGQQQQECHDEGPQQHGSAGEPSATDGGGLAAGPSGDGGGYRGGGAAVDPESNRLSSRHGPQRIAFVPQAAIVNGRPVPIGPLLVSSDRIGHEVPRCAAAAAAPLAPSLLPPPAPARSHSTRLLIPRAQKGCCTKCMRAFNASGKACKCQVRTATLTARWLACTASRLAEGS